MTVPIFINCRDRLQPLIALLNYLERAGQDRIYLLDNDSAYPPLLEYLSDTPHRVIRLGRNLGRLALWDANVLAELSITGRFVFSDPDVVPVAECPRDAIEYFAEILDAYPDRAKAGFGLKIDDLPDRYRFKNEVVVWESQFWEQRLAARLYDAPIDTTFALYQRPTQHEIDRSIRTGYPYVARHTPWYLDDRSLPDDEAFYRERAEGSDVNHWGGAALPAWLAKEIANRQPNAKSALAEPRLDQVQLLEAADPLLASAWCGEPDPHDEARNTPWAEPGWHSWNDMSPEVEICHFVVALVEVLRPPRVIETGTGQEGFITRRVKEQLRDGQRLTCFESDPAWREALRSLAFFDGSVCLLSPNDSPDDEQMAVADLCFLDSDFLFACPRSSDGGELLPKERCCSSTTPEADMAERLGMHSSERRSPNSAYLGSSSAIRAVHSSASKRRATMRSSPTGLQPSTTNCSFCEARRRSGIRNRPAASTIRCGG
jgi:hypothetical protein